MIEFFLKNWIEIIGATIGIIYLYLEYKANILMWPTGIIMSSFYTVVFINSGFYAFAIINIYYIAAGVYGWYKWYTDAHANLNNLNIKNTPTRLYIPIIISIIVIFSIVAFALYKFTDSNVIVGDSFITTLSIIAIIMLAKKYAEQWILLIVVNIASVIIYFYQDLYPTSIMYFIYSIVSIFGYLKWKKMIKN